MIATTVDKDRTLTGLTPAVEVTRGDTVESVHYAAAAVVDHDGNLVAHLGDPDLVTFSRSSLKPFQALPTVGRGFPQRFGLESRHLALVCASHSGEERHVRTAQEILTAIGAQVSDLQCGVHVPLSYRPDDGPVPAKSEFTQLHNNCSGKHSGMLALARILNCPLAEYLQVDSPVQRTIREVVVTMTGVDSANLQVGTDGCSAPNYAMPLRALAYAYARLAGAREHAGSMDSDTRQAAIHIVDAMTQNPEMVSGTGRLDLAIALASGRQLFVKAGGEAVQCIGVPERGWGIVIKIGDGGARAVGPLAIDLLRQLDILDPSALAGLGPLHSPQLRNHRGIKIGSARCVARLVRD